MKQKLRILFCLAAWLGGAGRVKADQLTSIEYVQDGATINLQSQRGVPISTVSNSPPGSDGLMPTKLTSNDANNGAIVTPATNQFSGLLSYGGVTGVDGKQNLSVLAKQTLLRGSNAFSISVAQAMQLPTGLISGTNYLVQRRIQIGAPFLSRQVSYPFGSVIPTPLTDTSGVLLTNLATAYWQGVPWPDITNSVVSSTRISSYYYSQNAGLVFATQPGPVWLTWITAASYPGNGDATWLTYTNLNALPGTPNFYTNAGNIYRLYTANYVISSTPVKPPQSIYWTEGSFAGLGYPVSLAQGRVTAIHVAYNNNVPPSVAAPYPDPNGGTSTVTNTLWLDSRAGIGSQLIRAYNVQGQVFVELLGQPISGGSASQYLGYEIVQIYQSPLPAGVTINLGDQLTPFQDGWEGGNPAPSPIRNTTGPQFFYQLSTANGTQLYADQYTPDVNDLQVYWLSAGVAGVQWPDRFVDYSLVWPTDPSLYSHYVRTVVASPAEAAQTAVHLDPAEAPSLDYQDPLDQVRGFLTANDQFYTWLTPDEPVHRALLRFNANGNVRFERVFSWLDVNVESNNYTGTIATNLTGVTDYPVAYSNYVVAYNSYLAASNQYATVDYPNYLVASNNFVKNPSGVNGDWNLYVSDSNIPVDFGSITSWSMLVDTSDPVTGALSTQEFDNTGGINLNFPNANNVFQSYLLATPFPSTITVSGITKPVTAIRVVLNGLSHTWPVQLGAFLQPPGGMQSQTECPLMLYTGLGNPVANATLVFDDAAPSTIPSPGQIASGTYQPSIYPSFGPPDVMLLEGYAQTTTEVPTLGALLQPVPTPPIPPTPPPVSTPWTNLFAAPRVVNATVNVGDRIVAPDGELGNTGDYLAGSIIQTNGNSFNPGAYLDPFVAGFGQADRGAIIPVNAIPGNNQLQVWWFRQNDANPARGFQRVYWPSVIGNYTIQWPTAAPQIIMAANVGTGSLDPTVAEGNIYYQNDPTQPGYNPNEEHAIMTGGAAYALCDDQNVTNATNPSLPFSGYSSAPFVLINYLADDGRPAMSAFQVRREAPELGILFDYTVAAGAKLQPPMPLPFLAAPLVGTYNYDTEPPATSGDLPPGWSNSYNKGPYTNYLSFTFQDRQHNFWVYRGPHAGLPDLKAGSYATNGTFSANLPPGIAVVGQPFTYFIHVSRKMDTLYITNDPATPLPNGLTLAGPLEGYANGLVLAGTPTTAWSNTISIIISDVADIMDDGKTRNSVTNQLVLNVVSNGTPVALGPPAITSTNQYSAAVVTYSNRPPYLAQAPAPSNSFTMQFYYKTQPSFAWPAVGPASTWPAVGSIVPYLLPVTNGVFDGDATSTNTASLNIVYRPYWPEVDASGNYTPTLNAGQTLTGPANGFTAIRGQDSVQVLYQQSIATNLALNNPGNPSLTNQPVSASVTLFDPTVDKKSALNLPTPNGLPGSVVASAYQGLVYFPNLPPNLISRFWFDPNTTYLVLQGQFNTDDPNNNYLLLNVLTPADLAAINGLCAAADPNYPAWTQAVAGLSANLYTFDENNAYGNYQIDPNLTVAYGATQPVVVISPESAVDSYALSAMGPGEGYVTYMFGNSLNPAHASDPVTMQVVRVKPPLFPGGLVAVNTANASPLSQTFTVQHTADLAGHSGDYQYDWRIIQPVNGAVPLYGSQQQSNWPSANGSGPTFTLGATGVQGLGDNYISVRYRSTNALANPAVTNWSAFTDPVLAPGWIARVLAAVNPFNQRTSDLYDNAANTTVSIISQAGARWQGNVPLNNASLTNSGLIAIYQTILNVGKALSIEAAPPINNGPANDALLLAAGYLNDLYMTLGNDAWANSLNPTIGFGTSDQTYGAIATSQFVFEGEEPTLLAQNLALLRGRDDSLSPGVDRFPVYNHLYWNYTHGIIAGEVIYALNYNIMDLNSDGVVNAADAAILYPQGHGDAYGHYLTALTGYYELLLNSYFDWVPHSEAVSVLGATVQVNYQDERKFASAAAAVARAGRQVFDLTWRQDYQPGTAGGWNYFSTNYTGQFSYTSVSLNPQPIVRYWGMDHWAARVGQGAYVNWVVGNAMLPPKDANPNDQGVQIVDRTTVPELQELPASAAALENDLDNANAGFTPLGLSQNSIPFDINPQQVTGANPQSHFEQVYTRAVQALNNAVVAFNGAQNVTQEMRQEQSSASDFAAGVTAQELAFNNQLIQIYGTPYPDDIGPGQTFPQGYTGPDLIHYAYIDNPETNTYGGILPDPTTATSFQIFTGSMPANWAPGVFANFDFYTNDVTLNANNSINFVVGPDGFTKPANWTSERVTPGSIQVALSKLVAAQDNLRIAEASATWDKQALDTAFNLFQAQTIINGNSLGLGQQSTQTNQYINTIQEGYNVADAWINVAVNSIEDVLTLLQIPSEVISPGASFPDVPADLVGAGLGVAAGILRIADAADFTSVQSEVETAQNAALDLAQQMATNNYTLNQQNTAAALGQQFLNIEGDLITINQAMRALSDAQMAYQQQVSEGNAVQRQRLTFRQHAAAIVQGYRTEDAAFLIFQNEKLQRYTSLFNLAAEYAYMAANAYDYETGLLDTPAGRAFVNQIINSSALGVIENGQPQISGTDTGDPGLANALAEMDADWSVLKGRLGFNNPDGYGTTVSLRRENYRIKPDASGDNNWQQVLQRGLVPDLLADTDVKQHCLQIDDGTGAAVPGIELTFSTTITDGLNLFGQILGPGDHDFSSSSFATKIFSLGVDLDGYVGMDNPVANTGAGGTSPTDPTLDPNALAATPYIYLIPCGQDSMRSPPLGDTSTVRSWSVNDVAIPLPFNISASAFSANQFYTSGDSLTEPLFAVRKQEAFRPVSTLAAFTASIYGVTGSLQPSEYTNQRLIGRSVWNSKWKLVIPGKTLLADPNQGLARFLKSVKDIHLYFITYSYSGN